MDNYLFYNYSSKTRNSLEIYCQVRKGHRHIFIKSYAYVSASVYFFHRITLRWRVLHYLKIPISFLKGSGWKRGLATKYSTFFSSVCLLSKPWQILTKLITDMHFILILFQRDFKHWRRKEHGCLNSRLQSSRKFTDVSYVPATFIMCTSHRNIFYSLPNIIIRNLIYNSWWATSNTNLHLHICGNL